jgi:UV DNA damage endonuclease
MRISSGGWVMVNNWQDFKCNVHISGRQGPAGIKAALQHYLAEARNCITIENDENSWGLDSSSN